MFLHIKFDDGSNPYVMYGDRQKLEDEMKKWSKNYYLSIQYFMYGTIRIGYDVRACPKSCFHSSLF